MFNEKVFRGLRDINRDFPYLVKEDECMKTIGARVVNELFLKYMFSLALTLHGGEESLTYSYGAPNHIQNKPKIPMMYKVGKNRKLVSQPTKLTKKAIKKLIDKDGLNNGKSTNPPDVNGIKCK